MASQRKKRKTAKDPVGSVANDITCSYYRECLEVQQLINLPEALLDLNSKDNKCYCQKCHDSREACYAFMDGPEPHNLYTKPIGWGRVMLKLPPRADHLNILSDWNVAFHGTNPHKLIHIVESGELLFPGDTTMDGELASDVDACVDGHINDDSKQQVFLSPSIKYAGSDVYAKARRIYLASSDRYVDVRTVLQVRVKPNRFQVGPQTIDRSDPIDPPLENDNIEWSTSARNCVIPVAVLIQVVVSPDPGQSETICPTCRVLFSKNNSPAKRTCRHQHVICKKCNEKFKDIYGDVCVLCKEPTYYQLDPNKDKDIRKRAESFVTAHDNMASTSRGTRRGRRICIYIKSLDGSTLLLTFEPTATLSRVKRDIEKHKGIPYDQQRLVYAGMQLEDDQSLSDYNIQHESKVHLVLKLCGS